MFPTSEFSPAFWLTEKQHLLEKWAILPERALSGHRNIARTLARTSSPVLLQAEVSQPLMDAVHGWLTDQATPSRPCGSFPQH